MNITLQRKHFTNGRIDHNKIARQKMLAKLNYEYKKEMKNGIGDWEEVERKAASNSASRLHEWAIKKYPNRNKHINNGRTMTRIEQPDGSVKFADSVSVPTTHYTLPNGEFVQEYGHCTLYFWVHTHKQITKENKQPIEWLGMDY